jgi:hypothetical protein
MNIVDKIVVFIFLYPFWWFKKLFEFKPEMEWKDFNNFCKKLEK